MTAVPGTGATALSVLCESCGHRPYVETCPWCNIDICEDCSCVHACGVPRAITLGFDGPGKPPVEVAWCHACAEIHPTPLCPLQGD